MCESRRSAPFQTQTNPEFKQSNYFRFSKFEIVYVYRTNHRPTDLLILLQYTRNIESCVLTTSVVFEFVKFENLNFSVFLFVFLVVKGRFIN